MLITIPLGARLLHVFYEEPSYYNESWIRVFEVWRGGFVYFGGLLFSLLFFWFYFRKPRARKFSEVLDFFTPVLSLGTGLGRIACFLQGCCYGQSFNGLWAVKGLHPTQLYIFFWEMLLFTLLLGFEKRKWPAGHLFLFWIAASSTGRFIVEFYRDDFRGQMIAGLAISQWISLGLITFSIIFYLLDCLRKSSGKIPKLL
jgi:phosphatidylglycerol---prolipoprotein diacylglyceryl transferase